MNRHNARILFHKVHANSRYQRLVEHLQYFYRWRTCCRLLILILIAFMIYPVHVTQKWYPIVRALMRHSVIQALLLFLNLRDP